MGTRPPQDPRDPLGDFPEPEDLGPTPGMPEEYLTVRGSVRPRPGFPGSRYVVGPLPEIVMRPHKTAIFDTMKFPEEGFAGEDAFFRDCKWFRDHTPKRPGIDTNMIQDSSLGLPLEYDLSSVELRFEKFCHHDDVLAVLRSLDLEFITGQANRKFKLSGSSFTPLIVLPHEALDMKDLIEKQLRSMAEKGLWTAYTHDMRVDQHPPLDANEKPEPGQPQKLDLTKTVKKPLTIHSTEIFWMRVNCHVPELRGPLRLKCQLQDTLYQPV